MYHTSQPQVRRGDKPLNSLAVSISSPPKLALWVEYPSRCLDEPVKLPQIYMQQAIQIATAQQPGKVLECRLVGRVVEDLWLAFYDVRIFSAEGAKSS